jgi:DNA (cytosine-5)-methyltransferase 1
MEITYKAISLFSGLGGDSLGIKQAGCSIIAYNELKPTFCKSHDANFPDSELICDGKINDISKLKDACFEKYKGKTDILFAGFPCFIKGTLVLTDSGYKEIQNVMIDDKLLTHIGEFQNIVNLQRKLYNGLLYNFKIKYHAEIIKCTEEHPFYVREKKMLWNNTLRKYEYSYGEPEWINANLIKNNHLFGMVINTKTYIPTFIFEKNINASISDTVSITTSMTLDNPEQWFMMGYFIGDGWIEDTQKSDGRNSYKIRFSFHEDDDETIEKVKQILKITYKDKSEKSVKYGCADFIWFNILKQFGKYAHEKKVPEWVQNAPIQLIRSFIDGYIAANREQITTVSYNLAYGLQRLYLKLGIISSVDKTIRPETCIIQSRTVNQRNTYKITTYTEKEHNLYSFIEGNYVWYTQTSSNTVVLGLDEYVYNFEVENDNSYIVYNTIAHNCQGFSTAGKRGKNKDKKDNEDVEDDDPRNTMFLEFLRATKITEPYMIIGENVKGLLTRKTPNGKLYIDIIVSEFEKIGYNVIYKVFKTEQYNVPQKRERLIILGIKKDNPYNWTPIFPEPQSESPNLLAIVNYDMTGAVKVDPEWFDEIPDECILTNMLDTIKYSDNNGGHPYLLSKINANEADRFYADKQHEYLFSFGKRGSPIHCEIIDIRYPSKTIICTYEHQPRLFVPLRNPSGCYLRMLLLDELKQIQGFPADYIVCGSNKDKIIQIGNAVPPPLIRAIVENITNIYIEI